MNLSCSKRRKQCQRLFKRLDCCWFTVFLLVHDSQGIAQNRGWSVETFAPGKFGLGIGQGTSLEVGQSRSEALLLLRERGGSPVELARP